MSLKQVIAKLYNPALGAFPLIVFIICEYHFTFQNAFLIGIGAYVVSILFFMAFFRPNTPCMLMIMGVAFLLYAIATTINPFKNLNRDHTTLLIELFLVLVFTLSGIFKHKIWKRLIKSKKNENDILKANMLNEVFETCKLYKYAFLLHLVVLVIYLIFFSQYHSARLDLIMFSIIPLIISLGVIAFEYIRISLLKRKIRTEFWLPIVNESGKVIGKVAKTISFTSGNRFLHPVVRVVVIHKGLLFLKERPDYYLMDPSKTDYPFEEYSAYKYDLNKTIEELVYKRTGITNLPAKFAFRYIFKNNVTNRLIYLYTVNIQNEETMNKLQLSGGKLWTEKQIEENLNKGVFSVFFEKEYEILKDTILLAEKLTSSRNNPTNSTTTNNTTLTTHSN